MLRTIKFRGFSIDGYLPDKYDRWVEGNLIFSYGNPVIVREEHEWHNVPVIPESVQQYVDKFGEFDIWEGDNILISTAGKPRSCTVRYWNGAFCAVFNDKTDDGVIPLCMIDIIKIIGNSYETSE